MRSCSQSRCDLVGDVHVLDAERAAVGLSERVTSWRRVARSGRGRPLHNPVEIGLGEAEFPRARAADGNADFVRAARGRPPSVRARGRNGSGRRWPARGRRGRARLVRHPIRNRRTRGSTARRPNPDRGGSAHTGPRHSRGLPGRSRRARLPRRHGRAGPRVKRMLAARDLQGLEARSFRVRVAGVAPGSAKATADGEHGTGGGTH